MSIRTQARLIAGWEIGVQARRVDRTDAGYSAGISQDGQLLIVREPGSVTLASKNIKLRPKLEDVILQFDAIGENLSLWVWRPGEEMPVSPQAAATDNTHQAGVTSLFTYDFSPGLNEGVFRFVHVDTEHIPEPSTVVLSCVGLACLLAWQRKKGQLSRA